MQTNIDLKELTSIGVVPLHGHLVITAKIPGESALVLMPDQVKEDSQLIYEDLTIVALSEGAYKDGLRLGDKITMHPAYANSYILYLPPGVPMPEMPRKAGDVDYLIMERIAIFGVQTTEN